MKKIVLFITIVLLVFFAQFNNVNAGVCKDKTIDGAGYCGTEGIKFETIKKPGSSELLTAGGARYLVVGFNSYNSMYGNGVAFCIDPALTTPTVSFTNIRELNLSTEFDTKVYQMYQKLVNDLQFSESGSNLQRAMFEAALRVWAVKYGYAYVTPASSIDYPSEAKAFVECADEIDDSILCDSGCKYKPSEFSGNVGTNNCFGSYETGSNSVKTYYNRNSLIWTNPFSEDFVKTELKAPSGTERNYVMTFTIANINKFFENSKAVSTLGLSAANFEATVYFGDTDCSTSTCDATITNNASGGAKVSLNSSSSSELKFTITMTPEQYTQTISSGVSKISLKYKYNHPMNSSNGYFSRKNASISDEQRMFGILNYVEEGVKDIALVEPKNLCEHVNYNDYILADGSNSYLLKDFIDSCGCGAVEINLINEYWMDEYQNYCGVDVVVTSNLNSCTVNSPSTENYNISYTEQNEINKYCKWTCKETINFNDVVGKYGNIKAGTYFELSYPTTLAKKYCSVTVEYRKWEEDYQKRLDRAAKEYSGWQKQINAVWTTGAQCSCFFGGECTPQYWQEYTSTYENCKVDGFGFDCRVIPSNGRICGERVTFGSYAAFIAANNKAVETLGMLGTCNNFLNSLGEDESFYKYEEDLNFYYEQELFENENTGIERAIKINDDYNLGYVNKNDIVEEETSIKCTGDVRYCYKFNEKAFDTLRFEKTKIPYTGNTDETYTIKRYVTYKNTYTKDEKYTKSYFGNVKVYPVVGDNNIHLGKVYDINFNAIKKNNNKNYFEFDALGDNNKIYNYFRNGGKIIDQDGVERASSLEDLKRYCSYSTINELSCVPGTGDTDCLTGTKPGTKIIFKVVDPEDIDPNGRLDEDNQGFENWKGKTIVKDAIEEADTFNPNNIEYTFELDAATIKAIREYNETTKYSDYTDYNCDTNGNYCLSGFITTADSGGMINGYDFEDSFATIKNGRKKWKSLNTATNTIIEKNVSYGH